MVAIEKQIADTMLAEVPRDTWRKSFYKTPLYIWRLGLNYALPPQFACITTRGRKSGLPRYTMVEHSKIGDKFYIVSGWQDKPHWVKNLMAFPQMTIQPVHGEAVGGIAQHVQDDITLSRIYDAMKTSPMWKPWLESLNIKPDLSAFLANKDRVYVFEITPDAESHLPPLEQDLRWATWLLMGLALVITLQRFAAKMRS